MPSGERLGPRRSAFCLKPRCTAHESSLFCRCFTVLKLASRAALPLLALALALWCLAPAALAATPSKTSRSALSPRAAPRKPPRNASTGSSNAWMAQGPTFIWAPMSCPRLHGSLAGQAAAHPHRPRPCGLPLHAGHRAQHEPVRSRPGRGARSTGSDAAIRRRALGGASARLGQHGRLIGYYLWMYDDGYPGPNRTAPAPAPPGAGSSQGHPRRSR